MKKYDIIRCNEIFFKTRDIDEFLKEKGENGFTLIHYNEYNSKSNLHGFAWNITCVFQREMINE